MLFSLDFVFYFCILFIYLFNHGIKNVLLAK